MVQNIKRQKIQDDLASTDSCLWTLPWTSLETNVTLEMLEICRLTCNKDNFSLLRRQCDLGYMSHT